MGDPADRTQYLAGEIVQCHLWFPPQVVTVIINLTPILDGTGPSRLLDIVEGRSKQTFKQWLAEPHQVWRDAVEVVAMDGFTGFKAPPPRNSPTPPA